MLVLVQVADHQRVRERHPGGGDVHANLVFPGDRQGQLAHGQRFRRAILRADHSAHGVFLLFRVDAAILAPV